MDQGAAPARHMFGAYEILETVGQGGMGVVYRAYDTTLKRVVALKILRDDLREQPHLVARFKREAEAFASLNHPNIVHIFSVGRVGRIPYLAMECIDGTPLSRLLKAERRLPWERALEIALEIAQALACAHRAQIIHRDIKPGNIIIGEDGHAYVTDFGIAKVLNAETQLTVDGARLGTPQYMSPERCQNKETTASSDIYSLGILLYQMIAGRLPFQSDTPVTLIQQIMVDMPPRLSTICTGIPENVDRLVAYMIEKNPAARPASAGVLCEIIERVRAGKPIVEHDGVRTETLREYREAQTPTPLPSRMPTKSPMTRLRARVRSHIARFPWHARSLWLGTLAVAAIAVGVASNYIGHVYTRPSGDAPPLSRAVEHWTAGPVARFLDEGPGVVTAEINLPEFDVAETAWAGPTAVIALLEGMPSTVHAGQQALVRIDTQNRRAELLMAPQAQHTRLAIVGGGSESYIWLPSRPASLFAWRADGLEPAELSVRVPDNISRDAIRAIRAVKPSPSGQEWLAAFEVAPSTWKVAVIGASAPPIPTVDVHGSVTAVHWNAAGTAVSIVVTRPDGIRELMIARQNTPSREILTTGELINMTGAFSPDGAAVLVSRMDGTHGRVNIVPLESGAAAIDLGTGGEAVWTTTGTVIVAAPDNQGRTQLFKTPALASAQREQLTYLSTGTSDLCRLSPSKTSVVTTAEKNGRPVLVFVNNIGS